MVIVAAPLVQAQDCASGPRLVVAPAVCLVNQPCTVEVSLESAGESVGAAAATLSSATNFVCGNSCQPGSEAPNASCSINPAICRFSVSDLSTPVDAFGDGQMMLAEITCTQIGTFDLALDDVSLGTTAGGVVTGECGAGATLECSTESSTTTLATTTTTVPAGTTTTLDSTTTTVDSTTTTSQPATTTTVASTTTTLPGSTTTTIPPGSTTTTTTSVPTSTTTPASTTTTLGGSRPCGDPVALRVGGAHQRRGWWPAAGAPRAILASDALYVLRAAVGSESCELCVCDVNGSGGVTASDALIVLRKSVGQPDELLCPVCGA